MFVKMFQQIYTSSIANDYQQRLVFMDLLVLADQNGVVDMTHEGIARVTNVPFEIVRDAIEVLESPDKKSRNPTHQGRRIVRLDEHRDWGWLIVNYEYYRNLASEEQRRERTNARVRKFRERNKVDDVTPCNASETHVTPSRSRGRSRKKEDKPPSADACASTVDEFMTLWCRAYRIKFGRGYTVARGKDHKRAKDLLVDSGMTAMQLMAIISQAWARKGTNSFFCQRASSIAQFAGKFNEIRAELAMPNGAPSRAAGTSMEKRLGQYEGIGKVS